VPVKVGDRIRLAYTGPTVEEKRDDLFGVTSATAYLWCSLLTAEESAARLQPHRAAPREGGPEEPGRGGVAGRREEQAG
jgi:hypothetical protein